MYHSLFESLYNKVQTTQLPLIDSGYKKETQDMESQSPADVDFRLTDKDPKITFYLLLLGQINYFVVEGMELLSLSLLKVINIKVLPFLKISISSVLGGLFSPAEYELYRNVFRFLLAKPWTESNCVLWYNLSKGRKKNAFTGELDHSDFPDVQAFLVLLTRIRYRWNFKQSVKTAAIVLQNRKH